MIKKLTVVMIVMGYSVTIINFKSNITTKKESSITLEATTFNDKVFAYGKAPKQGNRIGNKLIAALDKRFIKKHKLLNKTIKCTITYITKKGNKVVTDSIIVKDIINKRFNGRRIDLYDENAGSSDNIKSIKLHLK